MNKKIIVGSVVSILLAGITTLVILYVRGVFDSYATKRDKAKKRFDTALAKFEGDKVRS